MEDIVADRAAMKGHQVEQLPETRGSPDMKVDGRTTDVYTPRTTKVDSVRQELKTKMKKQGNDVVLALDYSSELDVQAIVSEVRRRGYPGNIYVTSGPESFFQVYP